MDKAQFLAKINENLMTDGRTDIKNATVKQLHNAVSRAVMSDIIPLWNETENRHASGRRAYYLSAEFLMGRAVYNNLYCAGLLDEAKQIFAENGIDINCMEEVEDAALGTAVLADLQLVSSIPLLPAIFRSTAMVSATATVFSSSLSATASSRKPQITGSLTEMLGAFAANRTL